MSTIYTIRTRILTRRARWGPLRQARWLGSLDNQTVYATELCGVEMALEIAAARPSIGWERQLTIFTDNQAAIRACRQPRAPSGQHFLRRIAGLLDRLRADGWHIRIHWLPGHEGVYGNEAADQLAKAAADGTDSRSRQPVLYASLRRRLRAQLRDDWQQFWSTHHHSSTLGKVFPAPSRAVLRLHVGLRRAASSVVIQMQTGKIALGAYLGRIGAMPTTEFSCGLGPQDVPHVLTTCPLHAALRLRTVWLHNRETDYARLLSEPRLVRHAAQFMIEDLNHGSWGNSRAYQTHSRPAQAAASEPPA